MIDPVRVFQEGGPFIYVTLAAASGNVVLALAFSSVAIRRRAPAWLALLPALLPLLFGILGTQIGLQLTYEAVAHASPVVELPLMANGIGVASLTTLFALFVNGAVLGIATAGASIGVITRWSMAGDEALSARSAATLLLLATIGTIGWYGVLAGEIGAYEAVSRASVETRSALLAQAVAAIQLSVWSTAAAAGVATLGGLGLMAPLAGAATRRTWLELGAGVLLVAALLGLPFVSRRGPAFESLVAEQVQQEEAPRAPLRELDLALARTEDCLRWSDAHAARVSVGADRILVDGTSVGAAEGPVRDGVHWAAFERLDAIATAQAEAIPGAEFGGILAADFAGDARWHAVRPVLAAAAGARFASVRLTAARDDDLCFVEATLLGPVHETAGTRRTASREPEGRQDRFASIEVEKAGQPPPVIARVGLGEAVPDEVTHVQLVPDDADTVQEVVDVVGELSTFRTIVLVVEP